VPIVLRRQTIQLVAAMALASAQTLGAATAAERVATDARAGRPLVAHVFVALCDNQHQGIVPVPAAIGNGRDPGRNLYWGAGCGVRTYLSKAPGWSRLRKPGTGPDGVLERAVFVRSIQGTRLLVVADAWDGARIRDTLAHFLEATAGRERVRITIDDQQVEAGGASHLVAFVGHNGLMDFAAPRLQDGNDQPARAAVVLACASQPYFQDLLLRARAYPLVMTSGLMAPEAYSLEAALTTWFTSLSPTQAREAAARAYDKYQHCGVGAARRLFVTGEETGKRP
jgi:hypothetical protein